MDYKVNPYFWMDLAFADFLSKGYVPLGRAWQELKDKVLSYSIPSIISNKR